MIARLSPALAMAALAALTACGDLPWDSDSGRTPRFWVSPTSLQFELPMNYTDGSSRSQPVWLVNEHTGFIVEIEHDVGTILSVGPGGAPIRGRGQDLWVTVQDPGALGGPGVYTGQVRIRPVEPGTHTPIAGQPVLTVDVTYVVTP